MALKIVSYNVNGVRAALNKDLKEWLSQIDCDIFCMQETKATVEQLDINIFKGLGFEYQYWFSAQKKGYSGVAILSKIKPTLVIEGCGILDYDNEGRILRADFGDWTLLNCYFPSGTSGEHRQGFKMQFLKDFFDYIENLKKERPQLIILGDYNIAHQEIDIHDPKGNKNSTGFLPEERAWMTQWFESGFTDAFRYLKPSEVQYSWWSYRAGARAKDKGWRIDYQSISNNLITKLLRATHLKDALHSDHCPVLIEIDI